MVEPQTSRFWQVAVKYGLMETARLEKCWAAIPEDKRTADAIDRRMARQAINDGYLTIWQAQQILTNREQALRIDRYLLLDVIGHGGMGRVYLAKDSRLNRRVALKILSHERMRNPRALARFRREAKVGAQLQHENLVRIYDEGEAHGVNFLVMEYIQGKTVGHLVAEMGRLPPAIAAGLTRQVCLGLEHLNEKGLIHRDVNPMNILVDRDGTAKLTDLGLAIDLGDLEDVVTRDGATVGTFDYISPEQARHSRTVDIRSDLYSLGCTIYHMISGHVPFPLPSLPEKLYAHQLSDPEPLAGRVPGVSVGLDAVVRQLMRKSVDDRFQLPIDAAKALGPFASGLIPLSKIEEASLPSGSELLAAKKVEDPAGLTLPSTGAATPESNGAPDSPPRSGSDPDLASSREASSKISISDSGSDPLSFLTQVDTGLDVPLSETRIPVRKSSSSDRYVGKIRVGIGVGILAVLIAIGLIWSAFIDRPPGVEQLPPPRNKPPGNDLEPPKGDPSTGILVRYPDGTEIPQASLIEAMNRANGGKDGAAVVIRGSAPIVVGDYTKSVEVSTGSLTIRSENGSKPTIVVDLNRKVPFIKVDSQGKLVLSGLRFQIDLPGAADQAAPLQTPTLIESGGRLVLDRCTFTTTSVTRSLRVVASSGLVTDAYGCLFEGFEQPISFQTFSEARARFRHCVIVRNQIGLAISGWAVCAINQSGPGNKPPSIEFERCTTVDGGLLAMDGFVPQAPLQVKIEGTAAVGKALLMWKSANAEADFVGGLRWSGKNNCYSISGGPWVVSPNGIDGLKEGPMDLKGWTDFSHPEAGSEDGPIKFAATSIAEGHPLDDLRIEGDKVGADPKRVGPEGLPETP